MKKIKLGKKIVLLEDFSASDLSKPRRSVTPVAKAQPDLITVDKVTSKPVETPEAPIANMVSGEEVRAEIIKDVDAILNNLDTLSKQITESALLEADAWFKDDNLLEAVEVINEEDGFLAKMFAKFKATKAYSTRMGNYSALLKKERKAEVTKIELGGQFDAKKVQVEAEMKDKIRDKFKTQINKVNQKDITPEAKKAIKDKIYAKRDELEKDTNKKIAEKIKAKREAITTKAGQAIKAAEAETKKMLDDNPIDNEKLTNQWEEYKLSQDNDHEIMLINLKAEANADADDKDEDQIEKDIKTAKEQKKKQEARAAERAKELGEKTKEIEAKEAAELDKLDDKQKEADAKINNYLSAQAKFDSGKMEQEEFDKVEKISASTFKDRDSSISDEDSEKLYDTLVKGSGEKKEDKEVKTDVASEKEIKAKDQEVKDLEKKLVDVMDQKNSRVDPAVLGAKVDIAKAKMDKAKMGGDKDEIADANQDWLNATQIYKEEAKKDESKLHESLTVAQKFKALM